MSTQQSGSVQSTCSADGRLPGLRRIGTTQAERRGDQMWPRGQVVIGGGRSEGAAMAGRGKDAEARRGAGKGGEALPNRSRSPCAAAHAEAGRRHTAPP